MSETVHVAVAVIVNDDNQVCISLRHASSHQGGLWEFPGGKVERGETVAQALKREIQEELTLTIIKSRPLITINHDYQDKKVCLHVEKILSYVGTAVGKEGQQVKWIAISKLTDYDFPAANTAIIKSLSLPDKYLITGKFNDINEFKSKLKNALDNGITLVQLRLKHDNLNNAEQLMILLKAASQLCVDANAKLLLNLPEGQLDSLDTSDVAYDGIHVNSKTLSMLTERPHTPLFSASCHNSKELEKAVQLNADFVVLSPVNKTASHPELDGMGWQRFSTMVENLSVPAFALGGVSGDDISTAWSHGAQGVSAISAFWNK